jgi:hypothetical protein
MANLPRNTSTILPNQIPPIDTWTLNAKGWLNQNCWLFLYNLAEQILGNQNNTSQPTAIQLLADSDTDASTTDPLPLFQRVANLESQQGIEPEQYASILAVQAALQWSQSDLLPDPPHQAQPIVTITPGASPYTYTAAFDGTLLITGGVVSSIVLSRGAGNVTTGLTDGILPMRRQDQVTVTYGTVPAMSFFPN